MATSCLVRVQPGRQPGGHDICPFVDVWDRIRAIARIPYSHSERRTWRASRPRNPGNTPQARSRATVDALLEATARILVREGFDRASTNRIADVAGVSIGSLYQYFPNKEALVAAVVERHQQDIRQVIQGELEKAAMLPIEQGVRMLVAVAVKSHRIAPKLHRVLAEQIPRVGTLEKVETFNRENFALFRSYLESRKSELRVKNLELAAFL